MVTRFTTQGLRAMGYPDPADEYHLPALSHLFANNMANVSLDRAFGGFRGPVIKPYFQMFMNLVRLTDLAIATYEDAREALDEYREHACDGRVSPFYTAINRLEECVVATHRATLNSRCLQDVAPSRLNAPTERQAASLRRLRNAIQHMDERLEKGQTKSGLHLLFPTSGSMYIGDDSLQHRDLASCITKMYRNIEILRGAPSK